MSKPNLSPNANEEDTFEIDGLNDIDDKFCVPDGEYELRCVDLEKDVSKSGNPMWVWDFAISSGPHAGKQFKMWTAITPSALWKLIQVLTALGIHNGKGDRIKFNRSDAINKTCIGVMLQDEYQGRMSSRIDTVKRA